MAALDFPDSPVVGDLYGSSGTIWRWSGTTWDSTAGASGARGRVAYAQITTPQTSITAVVNLTGLAAVFVADPTRTYRTTLYAEITNPTVAASSYQLFISDAAGVQITYAVDVLPTAGVGARAIAVAVESGLSGSTTRKAMLRLLGGTGTLTVGAGATNPTFILVEDITFEAGTGGPAVGSLIDSGFMTFPVAIVAAGGTNLLAPAPPVLGYASRMFVNAMVSAANDTGVLRPKTAINTNAGVSANRGWSLPVSTSAAGVYADMPVVWSWDVLANVSASFALVAGWDGTPTGSNYFYAEMTWQRYRI